MGILGGELSPSGHPVNYKGDFMNYLEIINKCLIELNYRPVNAFEELTKNEHKKIMNILNVLNSEICLYEKWNFLIREAELNLGANLREISNTVNGRISQVLIDEIPFLYCDNAGLILAGKYDGKNVYSFKNNKIIFAKSFPQNKTVKVIYYTYNSVKASGGTEKAKFSLSTDETLLPDPFAEPILVYGTCMRLKGNPQHIRFNYWLSMYKDALANMVSKYSIDAAFGACVKLRRY